jgi:Raf kinase inhibitor-like YbhB/YbcL family protein
MTLIIRSRAFGDGERIPLRHTGDGEDLSPPLQWAAPPGGTRELALIVDDPDAPTPEPWVHWLLLRISPSVQELPEALPCSTLLAQPAGAIQGKNSWNSLGYRGPAPPRGHGLHHYRFRLYALDTALLLKPEMDIQRLESAMQGHVLAQGTLTGTYQR